MHATQIIKIHYLIFPIHPNSLTKKTIQTAKKNFNPTQNMSIVHI